MSPICQMLHVESQDKKYGITNIFSFRNIVVYVLFRKISVENGEEMVITNLVINQVPGTFSSCLLLLIKVDDQRSLSLC